MFDSESPFGPSLQLAEGTSGTHRNDRFVGDVAIRGYIDMKSENCSGKSDSRMKLRNETRGRLLST